LLQNSEEGQKVAGYSIEIWNTLCEEEIELAKNPNAGQLDIIKNFKWQELATLFYNGLVHTGFDEADHSIDDDNECSLSLQCSTALSFLAQILKDDLLDITF